MNTIKKMQKVHLLLLLIQLLFVVLVLFIRKSYLFTFGSEDGFYMYLVPVLTIVFILLGNFLFTKRLQVLTKDSENNTKEQIYSSAALTRMFMSELALAVGLIGYYISGNLLYLGYSLLMLVFFVVLRPTEKRLRDALTKIGL